MKKLISLTLAILITGCSTIVMGAQKEVVLTLDGEPIQLEQEIIYENDRMMLPVRAMADVLGAAITYDANTRTATVTKPMQFVLTQNKTPMVWKVSLGLDSEYLTLMDTCQMLLETKPLISNGRAYLPLRELAEAMNLDVVWQSGEQFDTVSLTSPTTPQVQLLATSAFDWETMSLMMQWNNDENTRFYTWDEFTLEKWNGSTWTTVSMDKDFIAPTNLESYSIPTGGPTDGTRERKFTFWQWEDNLESGKYRVAVPYQYQEGNGTNMDFFTLQQTDAYESDIPTMYMAYCEFVINSKIS